MKMFPLRSLALLAAVLMLSGCFAPKTPQEVAQRFWEAVISDDAAVAVEYSTLVNAQDYDGFSRDWSGFHPVWGRVVIEGDQASIAADFNRAEEKRSLMTYLVRQNDRWTVDYLRTGESLQGNPLERLLSQLGELGSSLSAQFSNSSDELAAEMERMGEQLREQSAMLSQQAEAQIREYSDALRQSMEELADSVERALKERQRSLSEPDRRALQEAAAELNEGSERLEAPSMQALADGSKSAMRAQQRLESVDDEAVGESYKRQWREWREEVEAELEHMLAEFSASLEAGE